MFLSVVKIYDFDETTLILKECLMTAAMLTESKNRSIKSFVNSARGTQFQKVPLSKIYINTLNNIRRDESYDADNMAELKESIRAAGMIYQPLLVSPINQATLSPEMRQETEGMEFVLCDGYRRALCLQQLAEEDPAFGMHVPVIITNKSSDAGVFKLVQLISGLQRQAFTPLETGKAFDSMMTDGDIQLTQHEVAGAAGVSTGVVNQYLKLLKLPEELQRMMNEGNLTFSHARALQMAPPGEGKKNWVELAKSIGNKTATELANFVKRKYHLDTDEQIVETKKPDGTSQRTSIKTRKAKEYVDRYKPEFLKRAQAAKAKGDEAAAALWQHRMDTLAWFFCNDESLLAKDLKDWEEAEAKREATEKQNKEAAGTKEKYKSALVGEIFKIVNTQPDDLEAPRPTLQQAYAAIKADLELRIAKGKEEKQTPAQVFGFDFKDVNSFMEEVVREVKDTAAKKKAARELKKARDAWEKGYVESKRTDLPAEAKAAAQKDFSKAIDDLKSRGVNPDEHEKAYLDAKKKAADKRAAGKASPRKPSNVDKTVSAAETKKAAVTA